MLAAGISADCGLFYMHVRQHLCQGGRCMLSQQSVPPPQVHVHTCCLLSAGTAMSFTAFPVLASLLKSMDLLQTPIGLQVRNWLQCRTVST
jgi:hypothetical protein